MTNTISRTATPSIPATTPQSGGDGAQSAGTLVQAAGELAQVVAAAAIVLQAHSTQAEGPLRAIAPEVTPAPLLDGASGAGNAQPKLAGATLPSSPGDVPSDPPTGIDRSAVPDDVPADPEASTAKPAEANPDGPGPAKLAGITPNQHTDAPSLSKEEANAACGPAAAVAFARSMGKDISLDEAAKIAREVGWDSSGMKGPDSQVALLDKLGMKSTKEGVDWEKVKKTVAEGKPVIIDTPGHYWVVEGFDPATGEFDFGKSGSVFAEANGRTKFKPEEMDQFSGAARSAIYLD